MSCSNLKFVAKRGLDSYANLGKQFEILQHGEISNIEDQKDIFWEYWCRISAKGIEQNLSEIGGQLYF